MNRNTKDSPGWGKAFGEQLASAIREHVERKIKPLQDRIAQLESRGVRYVGTWQRAATYDRGEVVTHDGSMWVAVDNVANGVKPGSNPEAWQLSAKGTR